MKNIYLFIWKMKYINFIYFIQQWIDRFGNRAKSIKNAPVLNEERSAKELKHLLDQAEKKIEQHELFIEKLQIQLGKKGGSALPEVEDSKIYLQTEGNK